MTCITTVVLKLFNLVIPNNTYFGQKDFQQCLVIKRMIKGGEKNTSLIINKMKECFSGYKLAQLDYIEIRNPRDLSSMEIISSPIVILIAAYVGKTRLIDNMIV